MVDHKRLIEAIRGESLAGWLFYNWHHRDPIADRILGVPADAVNTRPWVYVLPAGGEPVKIVHAIEESILDRLPGAARVYRGREEFGNRIRESAAREQGSWGAHFSSVFPRYSTLDHGAVLLFQELGVHLCSADALILRVLSLLTGDELESHEQASRDLHRIIGQVWDRICRTLFQEKAPLHEGEVLGWIMEYFSDCGLETDGPLIVGTGRNTRLPHYFPEGRGALLRPGQVVQLDIWGKRKRPGACYADISWSGVLDKAAPEHVTNAFTAVARARDRAVAFLAERLEQGKEVSGADLDGVTVASLEEAGYAQYIRHRTGHAIDTDVHGFGINIDASKFPDHRPLRDGSCFSIEPGVYLDDFGIRTEIDVYIKSGRPVISGGVPQSGLLLAKE